jgi:hypothetical protein
MKLLDNFLNQVLINNLSKFIIADFISDLTIIKFDLKLIIIINGLIFILSLICSISVLLSLRKIKPINIIKAKEL